MRLIRNMLAATVIFGAVEMAWAQVDLLQRAQSLAPSSAQVSVQREADALAVKIEPGAEGYPGFAIKPAGGVLDLSSVGYVEARVTNTGERAAMISLRVDNKGDWQKSPWNTESAHVRPGESGVVRVYFGLSHGRKPSYPLNPAEIVNLLVFTGKAEGPVSFRVDALTGGGQPGEKPPVAPQDVRTKPTAEGWLVGGGLKLDLAQQVTMKNAKAAHDGDAIRIEVPAGKAEATAVVKPAVGRWDLRECLEVRLLLRNDSDAAVALRARTESNGGPTDWVTAELAPGERREVPISFIAQKIWTGKDQGGTKFSSDTASGVTMALAGAESARSLVLEGVKAGVPEAPKMPEWLGKRPPVDGDWVLTFNDDFDGDTVDASKWNIYGENYWDKQSHFSRGNTLVGGGVARLRFEKKRGHQNDDPKHARVTDYATGYLESYGKWVQRYGYFEARMKLPTAPGLWPAFWMMPDRGAETGPQWVRADIGNGGMEFDIMEYLTRWGPYRYNIAMHWDGYGKDHKSTGSDRVYFQPDAEGYITTGLLWLPGELVYYCNGQEVARWENERVSNVQSYVKFTLPMGGWDNSPLDDATLPDDFVIDWVRAWQRKDLASEVDGFQTQKP